MNRILITGGGGHIGRHLVDYFSKEHYVTGTTRQADHPTLVEMRTPEDIESVLDVVHPNIIIHAGFPGVRPDDRGLDALLEGVRFSEALAQAARAAGVERVVNLGSMSEYSVSRNGLHETAPTAFPSNQYGCAKVAAAAFMRSALQGSTTQFVHARLFNVYGPGEASHRLIPFLVRCIENRETPSLSSGEQRRDFVYITDVVKAIDRLCDLSELLEHDVYNVCTGVSTPVADVIRLVYEELGEPMPALGDSYRSGEFPESVGDPQRARVYLGWNYSVDIKAGVKKTVEHFKSK